MPRNGDGSSDNGPIEGHEILHGTSGDTTLQHTKHVAPMPDAEAGDALPGMNASGGVAAPISSSSEEYGANAPKHERLGSDESTSTPTDSQTHSSTNVANKSTPTLSHISTQKADKYTSLDQDEINMASASTKEGRMDAKAQRRADAVGESKGKGDEEVKKFGGHVDVEELHGSATLGEGEGGQAGKKNGSGRGSSRKQEGSGGGDDESATNKEGQPSSESNNGGKGGGNPQSTTNELEQVQRKKAEKFGVNLGE